MLDTAYIKQTDNRIRKFIRKTPLLSAPLLNDIAKRRIFIKAEALQYTGSFKYRGAISAISALSPEQRAQGVIAYSSGNHAQGVALAAQNFATKATIIMPQDAPEIKIANTRAMGADIVFYDRAGKRSREHVVADIMRKHDMALILPFDDENVIAGQGTCGLEIVTQSIEAEIKEAHVLVCCGGGGLTAGIALALAHTKGNFTTHPVEPIGFDDVKRSLEKGKRCENLPERTHKGKNICDAILTPCPGEITFPILKRYAQAGIAMSEYHVKCAMREAFRHFKLVLEPGGAIALAAALYSDALPKKRDAIVIASGGNVDPQLFANILSES